MLRTDFFVTPDDLAKRYAYDPHTGIITFRKTGKQAGTINDKGYRKISFCRNRTQLQLRGSRVAWCLFYGDWPPPDKEIDHIDRNRSNDSIFNLRLATRSQNCRNLGRVYPPH